MGRILIADDHDALRRGLARGLAEAGHEVEEASNGNAAIERLHDNYFDVVLSDLKMGGSDGLDVLRTTRSLHPTTAVILMTAFGSVNTAVEAMKIGAFDYVQKPFEIEEMELKVEKALEHRRLKHEIEYLRHTQQDIYDFDRIVGGSTALQRVLDIVKKVAKSNTTVLIRGETGTGKELIAGATHHNSLRVSRNFVKVNCAALQENLLESELFGHEKGAFTGADKQRIGRFEQADGGTLFLDEIGDMSPSTQAKILRVLQEHEFERLGGTRTLRVDVRLIAATNRDLSAMVASGAFREDLYYRLNVVSIEMPPLRERKDDIVPLANAFIHRFAAELKKKMIEICKTRNKPSGILIRKMDYPSSAALDELRRLLAGSANSGGSAKPVSIPILAYRVYPDGREELVRGLRFRGFNARSFKDILAASDENYVFEFLDNGVPMAMMGAGSTIAQSCVIAPSLLIDDLEMERMEEEFPKIPIVPPPT